MARSPMLWGVLTVTAVFAVVPPSAAAGLAVPGMIVAVPGVPTTANIMVTAVGGPPIVNDVHIEVSARAPARLEWLDIPGAVSQVVPLTNVNFAVTVTVPAGTPDGRYFFDVGDVCDGVGEGPLTLIVAVGTAGLPVALEAPVFHARKHLGHLAGTLSLAGSTPAPSSLTTLIVSKGTLVRRYVWALVPGRFARTKHLDLALLPGKYSVRTTLARNTQAPEYRTNTTTRSLSIELPAPVDGLVDKAWISGRTGGPPTAVFPTGTQALYAAFHFVSLPRHGSMTTTWYVPDGTPTRSVAKFGLAIVRGFVRSGEALTPGRWRCVLRVDGVIVAQASVQIR